MRQKEKYMKIKFKIGLVSLLAAGLIFVIFVPPSPAWGKITNSRKVDSITVTAQKREENPQDIPISMDAFSSIQIEDAGVTKMTELTRFSPNLFSTPSMENNSIVIRGVSTLNAALNPAAGIFVNDISYPLNRMQNPDLMDIERIEILRGPQGTLYGKNTESGAINIVTRQPDNDLKRRVYGEYGFYDSTNGNIPLYRAGGSISGPIQKDTLFMGLAFQAKKSDGYMKNIHNNNDKAAKTDRKTGQINLRWTPAPEWEVSFIADLSENQEFHGTQRYADGPGQSNPYKINWNGGNDWKEENNNQVIRAGYRATHFDLLSITSRSDYIIDFVNDADFGPFDYQNQDWTFDTLSWSQEIRLSSPKEAKIFQWVAGLYGAADDTRVKAHTPAYASMRDTHMNSDTLAIFGQGTYTLYDRLHLTAGMRYEYQKLKGEQINRFATDPYYDRSDTNKELLPKVSAAFDLTRTIMAYTTIAKGFLSGGYDFHMSTSADDLYFKPEHTTSYEAGLKTCFFKDRLTFNAAVFHLDIEDKQVVEWPAGQPVTSRDVTNAGKASSEGVELDLKIRPWSGFDIFAGFGYTRAQFDDWTIARSKGGTYSYEGNDLPMAPRYTFNAGAQYRLQSGWFVRADLLGTGDYYTDSENTQKIDGYETVNFRIGYEQEDWDIVLWANNAFDKKYIISKANYLGSLVQDGEPRSIGVKLTYRF